MSCKFDKKLLYSLEDDTIEPLERIFAEEHLKYCSECKKEFELIKNLDKELNECDFEMPVPKRLSNISQLVAENCISEMENGNKELQARNSKEDMKLLKRTVTEACKMSYNNQYNKFIGRSLTKTINFIGKPIKNYYKKKISETKIGKLFKVV